MELDKPHPQLLEQHRREFKVCNDLLNFARGKLSWAGRPLEIRTVDVIVAAEAARATKSYRAGLLLCASGFGQQGMMLSRGLFEGMLVAHWAVQSPKQALERYEKHSRHAKVLWSDLLLELGWITEDKALAASTEERSELTGLFGVHGHRHWTGMSTHRLVEAVASQWDDGGKDLREFHSVAHRESNLILHSTAWALDQTLLSKDSETVSLESGPSNQYVDRALYALFWTYVQMVSLAMDHFEMSDRDELSALHERGHRAFRRLPDDVKHQTGRNDPCPCGSGKKFKHCHGR